MYETDPEMTMAEDPERTGGEIEKRDRTQQYLKYGGWALMGVGALYVAKLILAVILKPVILVGGAVAGGVGWWLMKRSRTDGGAQTGGTDSVSARADGVMATRKPISRPPAAPPGPPPGPATLDEDLLRDATRELDAELTGPDDAAVRLDALDEMERRLQQLEELKRQVRDEDGDA